MVTGIVVNRKLALPREKRRMVRAMRNRLDRGEVAWNEMAHVMGWITFEDYIRYCDESLPQQGSHISPRVGFRKLFKIKETLRAGCSQKETAKRHEVSISSVARAENHYHSMLSYAVATAKSKDWTKHSISSLSSTGKSFLHVVADAGRLNDLVSSSPDFNFQDLLRVDVNGRTALGLASQIKDLAEIDHELTATSMLFEQITGKALQGDFEESIEMFTNALEPQDQQLLLDPLPNELFPAWIFGAIRSYWGKPLLPKLRFPLVPPRGEARYSILRDAASIWMHYIDSFRPEVSLTLMSRQDLQGQTLLHYWVTEKSLKDIPIQLRNPSLLSIKNNSSMDVFEMAELHQNLDMLPLEVLHEWNSN